jgi:hypothetical protein
VAGVLADGDHLNCTPERQDSWRWIQGQASGAREAVGRLLESLDGTLSKRALRTAREHGAELLRRYAEECEALFDREEIPPPTPGPKWSAMTDDELADALHWLVVEGLWPPMTDDDEGDEE